MVRFKRKIGDSGILKWKIARCCLGYVRWDWKLEWREDKSIANNLRTTRDLMKCDLRRLTLRENCMKYLSGRGN